MHLPKLNRSNRVLTDTLILGYLQVNAALGPGADRKTVREQHRSFYPGADQSRLRNAAVVAEGILRDSIGKLSRTT